MRLCLHIRNQYSRRRTAYAAFHSSPRAVHGFTVNAGLPCSIADHRIDVSAVSVARLRRAWIPTLPKAVAVRF
eukprot:IDg3074t1